MKQKVAILKCLSYSEQEVYTAVKTAVDLLGGMGCFVKKGERILLKPNLLAGRPPEAAVTTHPAVVAALIRLVKEHGATPVVGDSPGIGSARKIAEKCGVLSVCDSLSTDVIELKDPVIVEHPGARTFKRLELSRDLLSFDGVINIPKLKTHAQMFLTLGVKNLFGCVPGKLKPQWHLTAGVDRDHFAGMLLDLYSYINPRLTVMDGVVGMEGNGPGNGTPKKIGLIFASPNAIAMDAAAATVLGAKPNDVPILKTALRLGINEADPQNAQILGADLSDVRVRSFKFAPLSDLNFGSRLPYFIDRRLRKALTSRPHVDDQRCTLCNVCVEVCPTEVMSRTNRIDIDYDRCIRCYCCQEMCPQGAITPREGWLKRIIPGL